MLSAITLLNTDFAHMMAKYTTPCDIYCLSRTCKTLMTAIGRVYDMDTVVNSIVYDRSLMIKKLLTQDTDLECIVSIQDRKLVKILSTEPIDNTEIKKYPSQLLFDSGYFASKNAISFYNYPMRAGQFTIKPFHVENINLYLTKDIMGYYWSKIMFDDGDSDTIIKYCEHTGVLKYFNDLVCPQDKEAEFIIKNYETYPKICKLLLFNGADDYFTENMSRDLASAMWGLDKHYLMSIIPFDMFAELDKKNSNITLKTRLYQKAFENKQYWEYLMSDKCKILSINTRNMRLLIRNCTPDMLSELYEKKGKRWSKAEQGYAKTHMKRCILDRKWVDGTYDLLVRANELGLTNIPDSDLWYHLFYDTRKWTFSHDVFMANTKFLLDRKIPLPDIDSPRFEKLSMATREKIKDIIIRELLAKLA